MNPSTAFATVLVDELLRGGVQDVVLSPGSRSTPVALAFAKEVDAGRVHLHVRIDERTAGFLAIGLAKVSRRPVAVLTTSGTAVANLLPAVVEASYSHVPLILLTADRPPELRGVGANQTINQVGIFGDYVRSVVDVGVPEARAGQNDYWRSTVSYALALASGQSGASGPVHLNLPMREPLVPDDSRDWLEPLDGRANGEAWTEVHRLPADSSAVTTLPARTLMIVGDCLPAEGKAAALMAEEHGWPVISEPSGNAARGPNAVTTGGWLLGVPQFWNRLKPEHLMVVGRPTVSRAVLGAMHDDQVEVSAVASEGVWPDPARRVRRVFPSLPSNDGRHVPDVEWLDAWRTAESIARKHVDAVLDESPSAEQHLVRALHAGLPADALLFAGSSLPIRHLFLSSRARDGVTVVANRGAAGIDGTTSAAVGAAMAWQRDGGGAAVALLGDLTFLHDSNALSIPEDERPHLAVVVLNNDGGGIFELLEPSSSVSRPTFEKLFGTPQGTDLAALCGAHRIPHTRVTDASELLSATLDPRERMQVVEVRADRTETAKTHRLMREAVEAVETG